MRCLTKVLVLLSCMAMWGSVFASGQHSINLRSVKAAAIAQYRSGQGLQKAVVKTTRKTSAKWVEVFNMQGVVIAHSIPSRLYQPPKSEHHLAVMNVLKTGKTLTQKGAGSTRESFFPVKTAGKVVGVVEVVM